MIVVRLMGGIGNQMFQYAAGRRLAYKNKTDLTLDVSWFQHAPLSATPRQYELHPFNIKEKFAGDQEILRLRRDGDNLFMTRARRLATKIIPFYNHSYVIEKYYHFNPRILKLSGDVYLEGYWQSERYFKDIEKIIRSEFMVRYPSTDKNKELLEAIQQCNSVSLHVRRGDYVNNPEVNNIHGLCGLDYYNKCIEYIATKIKDPRFFIFSDEPEWAKEQFHIPYKMSLIEHNGPDRCYEDLRIMSHCKHHIIANSSFSWWGAWLNTNPEKIVVSPERWFNDKSLDTKDLIPEGWLKL